MMILLDYLRNNTLIVNTYNIINYDYLSRRFRVRYGKRELREDLTLADYSDFAQNVVDINIDFFRNLLENVLNPFESWNENGTNSDSGELTKNNSSNGSTDVAHNGNVEHTSSGTITDDSNSENTTTGTSNTSAPSTTETQNKINAYNSVNSVPANDSKTTVTSNSDTNYNDKQTLIGSNTQTLDTSNKDIYNNSDNTTTTTTANEKQNTNNSGVYSKQGFNVKDYEIALNVYNSAYDIIIDYIAREILMPVADIWG